MKVSREVKAAINRRAYFVARALMRQWVQEMTRRIEQGSLRPDELGQWWPAGATPGENSEFGTRRLVSVGPADVCGDPGFDATDHLAGF